jgi:preprotein translocase subunit YajC
MYSILLQAQGQQPGLGSMIVPFALIFVVMYFFMFRPQQKKMKDQKKFLAALEKGTKVVTIGGLHGTIVEVNDQTVLLQVDTNVKLRFDKSSIALDATQRLGQEGVKA